MWIRIRIRGVRVCHCYPPRTNRSRICRCCHQNDYPDTWLLVPLLGSIYDAPPSLLALSGILRYCFYGYGWLHHASSRLALPFLSRFVLLPYRTSFSFVFFFRSVSDLVVTCTTIEPHL